MSLIQELAADLADLRRRFENTVRLGTIAEADYPAARVRVAIGPLRTAWLPWLTSRAGADRSWHAPELGEQVVVLSPSGDLAQGVVLPAIFYNAHPANAATPTVHRATYADGAVIEYDRAAHELKLTIPGRITLNATGHVSATIGGNLSATVTGTTAVTSTGTVSLTSSAGIALNAPAIGLNGAVTIAPAPGGAGGSVSVSGSISAQGQVADGTGSLASLRSAYNTHRHTEQGDGAPTSTTSVPNP